MASLVFAGGHGLGGPGTYVRPCAIVSALKDCPGIEKQRDILDAVAKWAADMGFETPQGAGSVEMSN